MNTDIFNVFSGISYFLALGLSLAVVWYAALRSLGKIDKAGIVLRNSIFFPIGSLSVVAGEIVSLGTLGSNSILTLFAGLFLLTLGFWMQSSLANSQSRLSFIKGQIAEGLSVKGSWAALGVWIAVMALGQMNS